MMQQCGNDRSFFRALCVSVLLLASAPGLAADPPSQRQLPAGTVVCTTERDIMAFVATQKPGLSCFRTSAPSTFAVVNRTSAAYELIKLTGGNHAGTVGWTEILVAKRPATP